MTFADDLSWTCHVCGELRPDARISVHHRPTDLRGISIVQNIRYCNDRDRCREGVTHVDLLRREPE